MSHYPKHSQTHSQAVVSSEIVQSSAGIRPGGRGGRRVEGVQVEKSERQTSLTRIWRPFVEKHYVIEFVRFLQFPSKLPTSCKQAHPCARAHAHTHALVHWRRNALEQTPGGINMQMTRKQLHPCSSITAAKDLLTGTLGGFLPSFLPMVNRPSGAACCAHVPRESIPRMS